MTQTPNPTTRIVLIGFMGSGKSSTAACLSERLGVPVFDMDALITHRSGLSSVSEIFSERGEDAFRELETEVTRGLGDVTSGIISTGGGVISRDENRALLRTQCSQIVFLKTSFESVAQRVAGLDDRPLFKDRIKAAELFQLRAPIYDSWADIVVETDNASPAEVCEKILSKLQLR
jgi:shikimate kinase